MERSKLLSKLWNADDFLRGVLWASIVIIIFYTLFPKPDYDLWLVWKLNEVPYGVVWTWLNPSYWTQVPYAVWLDALQAVVVAIQWQLVRMGKLSKTLVILNIFNTAIFRVIHAEQNITVIMFAPFATIEPIIPTFLLLFQKLPLGWSLIPWDNVHWYCAFGGNGTGSLLGPDGVLVQPCLSMSTHLDPIHAYSALVYPFLLFWLVMPLLIYRKQGNRGKFESFAPVYHDLTQGVSKLEDRRWIRVDWRKFEWCCDLCGTWMLTKKENGFWFSGSWLCWQCTAKPDIKERAIN